MSDGTPAPTPINEASGAVTSNQTERKNPSQGKFRSGFSGQKPVTRVDTNKHGIRRETTVKPNSSNKKGRPKKV